MHKRVGNKINQYHVDDDDERNTISSSVFVFGAIREMNLLPCLSASLAVINDATSGQTEDRLQSPDGEKGAS